MKMLILPKYWRIHKILTPSKILADIQNIGGYTKYWRLPKYWRIYKILAPSKIKAYNRILAGVEISTPSEIPPDLEKVDGPLTVWARRNLQLLTSSWTG
jgi:hypothetical protein